MSETDYQQVPEAGASTAVEQRQPSPASTKETAGPSARAEALGRDDNPSDAVEDCATGNAVKLCRHAKEDGVYCHSPALSGRPYCYSHLRLRGQQMRMARAVAQRLSYQLALPPLEDMNAVQSALTHVAAALTAGLLERRRAGQLLYALQQAANNLRFLARAQATLAPAARSEGVSRIRG